MGYAIPISAVAQLISQLMTQETQLNQTSTSSAQQPSAFPGWWGNRPA